MRRVWNHFCVIALGTILLPVTACSVDQPPEQQAPPVGTITNSVAVLPFESDTLELADVAVGVYEEALNQLASVPDLSIVGREAMLPYSNMNLAPEEIALQLGVGHVFEGSIQYDDTKPTGKLLIVSVTRVYAHTGEPSGDSRGSARHIQDVGDVAALQSEMATTMATAVQEIVRPRN
jgi:TolB-like protein